MSLGAQASPPWRSTASRAGARTGRQSRPPSCRAAPSPTRSALPTKCCTPATGTRRPRSSWRASTRCSRARRRRSSSPAAWERPRSRTSPCLPRRPPGQQRLDRRHPPASRGARPPRHRRHLRGPLAASPLASLDAEEHPGHLRRDPDQSHDAGAGPGADRPGRPGVRPGAAGGRDLRQPDQLPPAGARRRRGDTSATKYLNGHSDGGRRRGGLGVGGGRGQSPAPRVGPGDRSAHRVAGGPRTPHPRRPHGAPQRQRPRGRALGGEAPVHRAGTLSRPRQPPRSRLRPSRALGIQRHGGARIKGGTPVRGADAQAPEADRARAEPRGVESLVSEPRLTSHRDLTPEARGGRHPRRISR